MVGDKRTKKSVYLAALFAASLGLTACMEVGGPAPEVPAAPGEATTTTAAEATTTTAAEATTTTAAEATTTTAAEATTTAAEAAPIKTEKSELGDILVDGEGKTVYGFTDDVDGTPTCEGACAAAWPAVTVEGDELPAGLDPAVFSLVDGVDGKKQLKAGDWPLYYFALDTAAGETEGQGVGDTWYVVSPEGELIKE